MEVQADNEYTCIVCCFSDVDCCSRDVALELSGIGWHSPAMDCSGIAAVEKGDIQRDVLFCSFLRLTKRTSP
jgi:hypothetical protein